MMETVFDSISDGLAIIDKNGTSLVLNPSARRITGIHEHETSIKERPTKYGFFLPDQKTPFPVDELTLVRAMRGEASDEVEIFIRNPNVPPEGVIISANARPLRDKTGRVIGGVSTFRDVTKLKQAEADLKQTADELRVQTRLMQTVFDSMSDGLTVVSENGDTLIHNPSGKRIIGVHEEKVEFEERSAKYGFFLPDRETPFPVDELPLVRAMRGEASDEVEVFIRNPNVPPEGVTISASGRPVRDETGRVIAGASVYRDVTKLKQAEADLKQTADELQTQTHAMETVFDSMADGVAVADENGKFTIFNPSARRITGIDDPETSVEERPAKYGFFYLDKETPFPVDELPLLRSLRGETVDEVEFFIRNPNVSPDGICVSVNGRPLRDETGRVKGCVNVLRDVTERVRAEETLAQAFSHGRLEIVDTILHDIGNAINSVHIGMGTIHENLSDSKPLQRFFALAEAIEAHREDLIPYLQTDPQGQKVIPFILALVQDFDEQYAELKKTFTRVQDRVAHIVDIIRTQRSLNHGTMARKTVSFQKAVAGAVRLLGTLITNRGVQIRIDCRNAPKEIQIEESKFHQMLVNLIKNAIEAIDELGESGGVEGRPWIRIRAYVEKDFVVLEVIDNGIGIDEKRSKVIFIAGYTTKETGSGLGLHSAANFVIGTGGQIEALSDGVGKGTTIRLKLRLSSVAPKPEYPSANGGEELVNFPSRYEGGGRRGEPRSDG